LKTNKAKNFVSYNNKINYKEKPFGLMKTKTGTQQKLQSRELKRRVSTLLKGHHQAQTLL